VLGAEKSWWFHHQPLGEIENLKGGGERFGHKATGDQEAMFTKVEDAAWWL
jgi:hypothetical protein